MHISQFPQEHWLMKKNMKENPASWWQVVINQPFSKIWAEQTHTKSLGNSTYTLLSPQLWDKIQFIGQNVYKLK